MKGFIDEIMNQESDNATWLIFADWLDEREQPHRIRTLLKFQELAKNHKAREESSSKTMRMLQKMQRRKPLQNVASDLHRDYTLLWGLLCVRTLLWDKLPKECLKPVLTAELAWCGLAKTEEVQTMNVFMNGLTRSFSLEDPKGYVISIVADLLWAMVDSSGTGVTWVILTINKINDLTKRQKWTASLAAKIRKQIPSL